jgi:3',5'-cyclic AMP phosphodiesterase CpdA
VSVRRAILLALTLALATCLFPVGVAAAPFTTVQRTIADCDGNNLLDFTFGEPHTVFPESPPPEEDDPCVERIGGERLRLPPHASIVNFLQLTDFQMVDEESPARVEFVDSTQRIPRLQPFSAAYRPQESLTTQVTEAMVRQARNAVSPVTGEQLDLAILTGDNADSQQYNETRWFIDILDGTDTAANPDPEMETPDAAATPGRKVNPNSGIPTTACEATPGSVYDGVRDRGIRPDPEPAPAALDAGYYDPDTSDNPRADGDGYLPDRADNIRETGRDVTVRDFPGLLESANEPFEAIGLDLPWYSAFGNHDALVQGNSPEAYIGPEGPSGETFNPLYHAIATGCVKVMQPTEPPVSDSVEDIEAIVEQIRELREELAGSEEPEEAAALIEQIDALTGEALEIAGDVIEAACGGAGTTVCTQPAPEFAASTEIVPPDPRRCFLAKDDNALAVGLAPGPCSTGSWIRQHFRTTGTPVGHGFAPGDPDLCEKYADEEEECRAGSAELGDASLGRPLEAVLNHDGYYSFVPTPGLRFVVLDTVTDECGSEFCSEGSVDDQQFDWLERQIREAATAGQYVVSFSHHTLRTTRFPTTDLTEQPAHYGQEFDRRNRLNPQNPTGAETLEGAFCERPNFLAHVAGHEHENYVQRHECADDQPAAVCREAEVPIPCLNPRFWEISTAAHIDWPQQSRMIELVNVGGDMSFVLTMLDHDGPANPGGAPPPRDEQGHAPDDVLRLAGVGREIAYNDYQADRGATGARHDRNVILPTDRPPPPYSP